MGQLCLRVFHIEDGNVRWVSAISVYMEEGLYMSFPVKRVDQLCVVISDPILLVQHYTLVDIKGVIINFSSEELYIGSTSWGGVTGKLNPNITNTLPAHSDTGEIVLLTLEINRDDIDPIENMIIGNFILNYNVSSGERYTTAPALFQLILQ